MNKNKQNYLGKNIYKFDTMFAYTSLFIKIII